MSIKPGDLVIVDGVRTLLEVCDVISETRFTAYWLIGNNWRGVDKASAQMMDFVFERDVGKSKKSVLHLYDDVEYEIVGSVQDGVYLIADENRTIPAFWG